MWPHEFRIEYRVSIGKALGLELTVKNKGETAFEFAEALHTYFEVGDVREARVRGLDGVKYLDNTDRIAEVQRGRRVRRANRQRISEYVGRGRVGRPCARADHCYGQKELLNDCCVEPVGAGSGGACRPGRP